VIKAGYTAARRTAMESPKREGLRKAGLGKKGLTRRKEGRAQNINLIQMGS